VLRGPALRPKEPKLTQFYRHALNRAQAGGTVSGDDQVPGTPSFYDDLIMDGLLSALLPEIREVFEGDCQAQIFSHYVNQNGPCAAWKFDKGRSTAGLQSLRQV
jgi:hypothetical protein